LTYLLILATVGAVAFFAYIFSTPLSPYNPFPVPTQVAAIFIPSLTASYTPIPPTLTPSVSPTETLTPTITLTSTTTAQQLDAPTLTEDALLTPSNTPGSQGQFAFALQSSPAYIAASVMHPEAGCKFLGVGGSAIDLQGRPVQGFIVELGGVLEAKRLDQTSLTGTAGKYGDAGYEFTLSDSPWDSQNSLWVRLVDQNRLPISAKVFFNTFADCNRNLVIINFKQVK
jgi:hypothetical protein